MRKVILLTGATDGIGFETAKQLCALGHSLLLHGRNPSKLDAVKSRLIESEGEGDVEGYLADFSRLSDVRKLAEDIVGKHGRLDVLINNAGIFHTTHETTEAGLDVRFVVNLLAPYLLTSRLLPLMNSDGRVINLSSAAQAPVSLEALAGRMRLSAMDAYAQSKLALTMWTRSLANELTGKGPSVIAVNPGSLLASKMVKEGFGVAGNDLRIGADVLVRAALSEEFSNASGQYFDNDRGRFSNPHPSGLDDRKSAELIQLVEEILTNNA
ncbi:SDR family NAD(P)-dependent oxidoreductase [Roseibium sp. SCP14]|uniref:SDR family NAD(P)-dependent oxidoreductase n=1 Tax=Roseibium sp. SCP14 TaxID=3141375 RepID=UPI00333CD968